jgi:hypothetical protein
MKATALGPLRQKTRFPLVVSAAVVHLASLSLPSCQLGQDVPLGGVQPLSQGGAGGDGGAAFRFLEPEPLTLLNSEENDDNPSLSFDLLTLCWISLRSGGTGDADIWCSTRPEVGSEFGAPEEASALNSPVFETSSALSSDALQIWFGSRREGGQGAVDIWTCTRSSRSEPWPAPSLEVALNSAADDIPRPLGFKGQVMPMASRRDSGNYATYFAERSLDTHEFSEPALVPGLDEQSSSVGDAYLLEDGLTLIFAQETDLGTTDLFVTERTTLDEPFQKARPLLGVNTEADERDPWLSPDGELLYFSSNRTGNFDLYWARRAGDE